MLEPTNFDAVPLHELYAWFHSAPGVAAEMGVTVSAEWRAGVLDAILRRPWLYDDTPTVRRLYDTAGRHNPRGLEEELERRG